MSKTSKSTISRVTAIRAPIAESPNRTRIKPQYEDSPLFAGYIGIEPPYDPESLIRRYGESAWLRPNIDAYATNVDGFGYRLEPTIDLSAPNADEIVRNSIRLERIYDGRRDEPIQDADIAARRIEIENVSEIEKLRLEMFLSSPSYGVSFVKLRKMLRTDLEITGNAYWEAARSMSMNEGQPGNVVELNYASTATIRMVKREDDVEVKVPYQRRISPASYRPAYRQRTVRRYVQIVMGQIVAYFKEFGDPRLMSAKTGKYFNSSSQMTQVEPGSRAATEIIHFNIHWPTSIYGVPRWVGALPAVVGSRFADDVNVLYFENKAVPPMAIMVAGGRLADGATKRIKEELKAMKGMDNFHGILVIEAESKAAAAGVAAPRVSITMQTLTGAQQQDALFMKYNEQNSGQVGAAFRLPRLLRGDTKDFNRATADAALQYAESQVFQPEREDFDHFMNSVLLADMGVRFWRFKSRGPIEMKPAEIAAMVKDSRDYITGEEGREILQAVFSRDFKKVEELWAKMPPSVFDSITKASASAPPAGDPAAQGLETLRTIANAAKALRKSADDGAELEGKAIADAVRQTVRRIRLPAKTFDALVVRDEA